MSLSKVSTDRFSMDARFGSARNIKSEHPVKLFNQSRLPAELKSAELNTPEFSNMNSKVSANIAKTMDIIKILGSSEFIGLDSDQAKIDYLEARFFEKLKLRVTKKKVDDVCVLMHVSIDRNTPWQEYMKTNNHRYFILDCKSWRPVAFGNTALYPDVALEADQAGGVLNVNLKDAMDTDPRSTFAPKIRMSIIHDGTPIGLWPCTIMHPESNEPVQVFEIATKFSYALSNIYWLSEFTWAEMFYYSLKESNPGFVEKYGIELITWYERYDQVDSVYMVPTGERRLGKRTYIAATGLSRDHSHNFILRHTSIHPYAEDANNVIYLESRRLLDSKIEDLFGNDCRRTIQIDYGFVQRLISNYYGSGIGEVDAHTLGEFRNMHKEDNCFKYRRFIDILKDEVRGLDAYPEWMSNSYDGVIVTVRGRSYVMTSAKLAMIENLVYQHGNLDVIQRIDPNYRREYAALRCILRNETDREILFPQWTEYADNYRPFFKKIVLMILRRCAMAEKGAPRRANQPQDPLHKFVDNMYTNLLHYLRHENQSALLDPRDKDAGMTIMQLILNPNHASTLMLGYYTFSGRFVAAETTKVAEVATATKTTKVTEAVEVAEVAEVTEVVEVAEATGVLDEEE